MSADRSRPLMSFSGSVQNSDDKMASYQSGVQSSYHSSITDDDLEEARQRLLAHQYDQEAEDNHQAEDNHPDQLPNGRLYQAGTGGLPPPVVVEPLPDNQSRVSRYGSLSTTASNTTQKKTSQMKRYRLPLLILLGFDWGLVVFLSIICWVLHKLQNQDIGYFTLDIGKGHFDLVMLATIRTVFNILAYILLAWVNRIVMTITTLASALYVPIKAYYLLSSLDDDFANNSSELIYLIALLMLIFVSFVVPWLVAFFFEFKYLPSEKARLHVPSWWKVLPWVWPRAFVITESGTVTPSVPEPPTTLQLPPTTTRRGMGLSASTVSLDFRTPIGSSRASPVQIIERFPDDLPPISEEPNDLTAPEFDVSPQDQQFKREAKEALDGLVELTRNNDGWNLEKTVNGIKCYSIQDNGRKILKADGVVETSAQHLWSILYPGDSTPEWNTQCALNETLYRVDETVDIVYTVSNPLGPVSSRDFVSVRRIASRDGAYYSSSRSTITDIKPEQSGRVRGENGPCGYVVIPIGPSTAQFIWVMNSNIKGWLPQAVVDQSVSSALLGAYKQLQVYAREQSATRVQPN